MHPAGRLGVVEASRWGAIPVAAQPTGVPYTRMSTHARTPHSLGHLQERLRHGGPNLDDAVRQVGGVDGVVGAGGHVAHHDRRRLEQAQKKL